MIIALFRHAWRLISSIEFVRLCVLTNAELRIPTLFVLAGLSVIYPFLLLICLTQVVLLDRAIVFAKRVREHYASW